MKVLKQITYVFILIGLLSCKTTSKYPNLSDGMYADIQTNKGTIVLQLEFDKMPNTVANFVSLAEGNNAEVDEKYIGKPFYDGILFHRVIPNFMIQGGDPDGRGSGGPGYRFGDEFPTDNEGSLLFKHDAPGTLSMANSGVNTNGSQFFITHKPTPHLDGKHSVFGHVVIGQDIVNLIAKNDTIQKIEIIRNGKAAKKFDAPKIFADHIVVMEKLLKDKAAQRKIELENAKKEIAQKASFYKAKKLKAKSYPSGLKMFTTAIGSGVKPKSGSTVKIDYAGFFEDGRLFDTSIEEVAKKFGKFDIRKAKADAYQPFDMIFNKTAGLVPGFREGMLNMNYGQKALLFIPSHLAYGDKGAGKVIPPNTDLVFEIEIKDTREKE